MMRDFGYLQLRAASLLILINSVKTLFDASLYTSTKCGIQLGSEWYMITADHIIVYLYAIGMEGYMHPWMTIYLSPLCSGVSPFLPQLGHFRIPNPWQSKHLQEPSIMPSVGWSH
jgi:hypothetical protein